MDSNAKKTLKLNFLFNILDGGFFGLAMGFASFVTILPPVSYTHLTLPTIYSV